MKRRSEFDPISLWNPVAGTCTFLPTSSVACETYVLLSDYDDLPGSCTSNKPEVRILAVQQECKAIDAAMPGSGRGHRSFRYQLFSTTSGALGLEQRSLELPEGIHAHMKPGTEVVCRGGAVHWLACGGGMHWMAWSHDCTCTVALDVHTGQTWTTELPTCWRMEA